MTRPITRARGVRRLPLWVALLLLLVQASGAAADGCEAVDRYDEPRDCTYMEELGSCLWDAYDSWDQCMDWADGSWLKGTACDIAGAVDMLACTVSAAAAVLK